MLADLAAAYPIVRETFAEGSDSLGMDLWALSQHGPKERLDDTRITQPLMLCAGIGVMRVLDRQLGRPAIVMAGHSLGEYTALVAAGVLDLAEATRLVALRGSFMDEAVPAGTGAMAAILGLDDDQIRAVCAEGAQGQVAAAVNYNTPGQVVVAGDAAAVARVIDLAKAAGAKRAVMLDVSVPSHCSLMKPAAARLEAALQDVTFKMPVVPVLHNVNVSQAADIAEMRRLLVEQLCSPVRWVETIHEMARRGAEVVLEAGPGKVLSGLVRRIDKSIEAFPVYDPASLDNAVESMNA
jgi:[acyl-carrier-protein] S-malonyltransferase